MEVNCVLCKHLIGDHGIIASYNCPSCERKVSGGKAHISCSRQVNNFCNNCKQEKNEITIDYEGILNHCVLCKHLLGDHGVIGSYHCPSCEKKVSGGKAHTHCSRLVNYFCDNCKEEINEITIDDDIILNYLLEKQSLTKEFVSKLIISSMHVEDVKNRGRNTKCAQNIIK